MFVRNTTIYQEIIRVSIKPNNIDLLSLNKFQFSYCICLAQFWKETLYRFIFSVRVFMLTLLFLMIKQHFQQTFPNTYNSCKSETVVTVSAIFKSLHILTLELV